MQENRIITTLWKVRRNDGIGCVAGGAKKRVGTRCLDSTLIQQPTVSTISLRHSGTETLAYSNNVASGIGGRAGGPHLSQYNYSNLPVQPDSTTLSNYSGIGARSAGTQPSQLDYFSSNNDRLI